MELINHLRFIKSTLLLFIAALTALVHASSPNIFFDWTVSYSRRAPLGVTKRVIVINNQFPGPLLNTTTNDVVNINVHNQLTEPFLMTWNGVQLRRNSWQDGVQETNCPILPGRNWTYSFQIKDQIGSFFYFPSLLLQKADGGYGAIRVNNREVIPIPFPRPHQDLDLLIGDWFNVDRRQLRRSLDFGNRFPRPDGILINGLRPNQASFEFQPGATYRLRISNVGLKTSLNFRIQEHSMLLVETEGSYTIKQYYDNLDIHVGQSYSVLVTAKNHTGDISHSYHMIASSRFNSPELLGLGIIRYPGSARRRLGPIPRGPRPFDYRDSMVQARSIRWDLTVGAARPNPQGSYHYGRMNITRTLIYRNGFMFDRNRLRYTVNGVSFIHQDTPLKLADYFQLGDVFESGTIPDTPVDNFQALGTSVTDATHHDFLHVVFRNPLSNIQTWHVDGYNFFVVGMGFGTWDESRMARYNTVDAVSRSTVQVYPNAWTAIMIKMDNQGLWNMRSQDAENWYLGQELYIRVKGVGQRDPSTIPERDEAPIPANVIRCGRATFL